MTVASDLVDVRVGKAVKLIRVDRGVSFEDAALMVGLPIENYRRSEAGERRFKPDELSRLASGLSCNVALFFAGLSHDVSSRRRDNSLMTQILG